MRDRRTARRYALSLPIVVRAPTDKDAASKTGKTNDISSQGVHFTIDHNLSVGAELDLTMVLPARVTGGTAVLIRALGKVLRVDQRDRNGDEQADVAAVFERYEIVRDEASVAVRVE